MDDLLIFSSWRRIRSRYGFEEWSSSGDTVVSRAGWYTQGSSSGGYEESFHYDDYDEGRWLV